MSEQTLTPNVKLTLTCGNSKCKQVITEQVVSVIAAPKLKHAMASQQIRCPRCGKTGRNKVADVYTDAVLTGGGRQVETAQGTVDVQLRSHKAVAPDKPRRDRGNPQRGNNDPMARGTRRRATRAAGKTAVPPMSERQRRKLERRGYADQLVAKSREHGEHGKGPQVPTPQPAKGQPRLRKSRNPAAPSAPRMRDPAARAAAAASAAAALDSLSDIDLPAFQPPWPPAPSELVAPPPAATLPTPPPPPVDAPPAVTDQPELPPAPTGPEPTGPEPSTN